MWEILKESLEVELRGLTEGLGVHSMYIIRIDQTVHTKGQGQKEEKEIPNRETFYFATCSSLGKLGFGPLNWLPQCSVF